LQDFPVDPVLFNGLFERGNLSLKDLDLLRLLSPLEGFFIQSSVRPVEALPHFR
jgi:hypothetical protein